MTAQIGLVELAVLIFLLIVVVLGISICAVWFFLKCRDAYRDGFKEGLK